MRLWPVFAVSAALAGCITATPQQQVGQVVPSAVAPQSPALSPPAAGRPITYDGSGRFTLPDGSVVVADASGGFTLPNGVYVAPDERGTLLLPNGARCVPDGAGGYICP